MAKISRSAEALFETTRRLLSSLINEGLCNASIDEVSPDGRRWIYLLPESPSTHSSGDRMVRVIFTSSARIKEDAGRITSLVRPDQLSPPVIFESVVANNATSWEELDPGIIFEALYPWFGKDHENNAMHVVKRELQNSAANQGKMAQSPVLYFWRLKYKVEAWLELGKDQCQLSISSPSIAWERSLIWGHPTHPVRMRCAVRIIFSFTNVDYSCIEHAMLNHH